MHPSGASFFCTRVPTFGKNCGLESQLARVTLLVRCASIGVPCFGAKFAFVFVVRKAISTPRGGVFACCVGFCPNLHQATCQVLEERLSFCLQYSTSAITVFCHPVAGFLQTKTCVLATTPRRLCLHNAV